MADEVVVVATGLVTPLGMTCADNLFGARANASPRMPAPYVNTVGDPVKISYCSWLPLMLTAEQRLAHLVGELAWQLPKALCNHGTERWLLTSFNELARPGTVEDASAHVRQSFVRQLGLRQVQSAKQVGAAACHIALQRAVAALQADECDFALLAAADTFVSESYLATQDQVPVIWRPRLTPSSEGAAALVLARRQTARIAGLPIRAVHRWSDAMMDPAADENDVTPQGVALTQLLQRVGSAGDFSAAFGPYGSEPLRTRDWVLATARCHRSFVSPWGQLDIETATGRLGAVSGLAHLVAGVETVACGTSATPIARDTRFLCWAMSGDGLRGVSLLQGAHR